MVNDLWELDLSNMIWKRKSSPPPNSTSTTTSDPQPQPRYFHSSDLWDGKLIVFGGMGYAAPSQSKSSGSASTTSKADELCVLDEIVAYDLITEKWDLSFASASSSKSDAASSSTSSSSTPVPRYAHLSSTTSHLLTIIGGQDMANHYVESISVFDLKQRKWIAQKDFGKQCGSYRSLAVAGTWGVKEGKGESWSSLVGDAIASKIGRGSRSNSSSNIHPTSASLDSGFKALDQKGKGREDLNGLDINNRLRAGSTASNFSNFTGISSSDNATSVASPTSWTTGSNGLTAPQSSSSRRPPESSPSSSTSAFSTSTSNEYKDASLPNGVQPISTSCPTTPTSSKFNSQETRSKLKDISPLPSSYEPDESDPLPIYVYSNFNFTNVNRQLGMVNLKRGNRKRSKGKGKGKQVEGEDQEEEEDEEQETLGAAEGEEQDESEDILGPSEITISDRSSQMDGAALPPGLRFPTGSVLGSYLLISGTYLANTSQTFSIWALHLPTLTWSRLEPGSTLSSGSWNRAVLWPTKNRLLILGHRDRSLVEDYNHRQTNWDHVVLVELEAWGIYQPPIQRFDDQAIELGLEKLASSSQGSMLAEMSGPEPKEDQAQPPQIESPIGIELSIPEITSSSMPASAEALRLPIANLSLGGRGDMEILCSDGMRIGCDREVLRKRWKWFKERDDKYQRKVKREIKRLLKSQGQLNGSHDDSSSTVALGEDDSSSVISPRGRKRASTMSDAIRAMLEDTSDESEEENTLNIPDEVVKSKIDQSAEKVSGGFDQYRRPSTISIQSHSTVLSERSISSYRPFRTPTTGFSSGLSPVTPSHQITTSETSALPTSHDPRFLPRQLVLNEPSPIVLAFLQFLYSQTLCTPLQRHPATIAALLVLAAAYDMPDLGAWARHAAHVSLTRDLSSEGSGTLNSSSSPAEAASSVKIYTTSSGLSPEQRHRLTVVLTESAALCGCEPLQIRALRSSMLTSKWLQKMTANAALNGSDAGRSRSGTTASHGSERSGLNESGSSSIMGDQMSPARKNEMTSPSIGSNRDTPTPTASYGSTSNLNSNAVLTSPSGSTSSHVRRWSLTPAGPSRVQPPSNPPPTPPSGNGAVGSGVSTGEPLAPESGTDESSDSDLPPLAGTRKPSTGLSKAERMLGITGAEAQAAGLPGVAKEGSPISVASGGGSEPRNPTQRRPSAAPSAAGSMLSVRSGSSSAGGGRKRFSIFGRSSNSSTSIPTNATTSNSQTASGDLSPGPRSSGVFEEDPAKRRSSDINVPHQQKLASLNTANFNSSSVQTRSNRSGSSVSHLTSPNSGLSSSQFGSQLQDSEASRSQTSLPPNGRQSLKSRPSNSSSVANFGTEIPQKQELSTLRSLGII